MLRMRPLTRLSNTASSVTVYVARCRVTATAGPHPLDFPSARCCSLYAPAQGEEAVAALGFSVTALSAAAARQRASSAPYLFRSGHWSAFRPPQARQ